MNFIKLRKATTLIVLIIASAIAGVHSAESLSVLLQKGIFAEETEGNLDAAIKIYEGIVKESDANRSLVAQASYRLGICQIKKGKKDEAVTAFRNLLEQFSDQSELALKTRERLSELGQATVMPSIHQIWGSAPDTQGSISGDGRFYAYVDWGTGNVALRDLKSGTIRNLTDKAGWTSSNDYALAPRISRDGKQVIYYWWSNQRETYELRVISTESSRPRTLIPDAFGFLNGGDWSPDGSQYALTISRHKTREDIFALVTVSNETVRYLKTNAPPNAVEIHFTPDGRSLVFSREPTVEAEQHDIFVMDLVGGKESPLLQHPADDLVLGWAPNGRTLLFSSDRHGTRGLWSVDIVEGKTKSEPIMLRPNLGEVSALGLSENGGFYYGVSSGEVGMAQAAVDFNTGKVLSPPKLISRPSGHSLLRMNLSPDGRQLAYYVSQQANFTHPALFLLDLETQQHRKVHVWDSGDLVDIPFWLPDNRTLLHRATRKDGLKDLSLVDTRSAVVTPVTLVDKSPTNIGIPIVLKGDIITYVRQDPKKMNYWLVRRNLKSGEESEFALIKDPDPKISYSFEIDIEEKSVLYTRNPSRTLEDRVVTVYPGPGSQDHVSVAVRYFWETGKSFEWARSTNRMEILTGPKAGRATIVLTLPNRDIEVKHFRIRGDRADELWTAKPPGALKIFTRASWTPDGQHLLCMDKDRRWWAISADSGEARKTELLTPKLLQPMSIHPDSKQIFFKMSEVSVSELWVMENFLPPMASAK